MLVLECRTTMAMAKWKTYPSTTTTLTTIPRVIVSDRIVRTSTRACRIIRTCYEGLREIDEGLAHAQAF